MNKYQEALDGIKGFDYPPESELGKRFKLIQELVDNSTQNTDFINIGDRFINIKQISQIDEWGVRMSDGNHISINSKHTKNRVKIMCGLDTEK